MEARAGRNLRRSARAIHGTLHITAQILDLRRLRKGTDFNDLAPWRIWPPAEPHCLANAAIGEAAQRAF